MTKTEYNQQVSLLAGSSSFPSSVAPPAVGVREFPFTTKRRRRAVRSQRSITVAILEACRTPTVQHWIMVKARLGYDTFWKHMNVLVAEGMMDKSNEGYKTLYYLNQKGLEFLRDLEASKD